MFDDLNRPQHTLFLNTVPTNELIAFIKDKKYTFEVDEDYEEEGEPVDPWISAGGGEHDLDYWDVNYGDTNDIKSSLGKEKCVVTEEEGKIKKRCFMEYDPNVHAASK